MPRLLRVCFSLEIHDEARRFSLKGNGRDMDAARLIPYSAIPPFGVRDG